MLNNYESLYEDLLNKSRKPSMVIRSTRSLSTQSYKTINHLNPELMKNLIKVLKSNRAQRQQHKLNLEIQKSNKFHFGTKSLQMQGPKVSNDLPFQIKSKENSQVKDAINFWEVSQCSYNICFDSKIQIFDDISARDILFKHKYILYLEEINTVILSTNSSLLSSG